MIGLTNDQILREGIMVPFLEKKTNPPSGSSHVFKMENTDIYGQGRKN